MEDRLRELRMTSRPSVMMTKMTIVNTGTIVNTDTIVTTTMTNMNTDTIVNADTIVTTIKSKKIAVKAFNSEMA